MATHFDKLNTGWNAQPNAPHPHIELDNRGVIVRFVLNSYQFPQFSEAQEARLMFDGCWRYRLGPTNDEGWYRGQCRFSKLAPEWGEFYEVEGDLLLDVGELDWKSGPASQHPGTRHFLFYFRDETFECDADAWKLEVLLVG
jgi:hypothetical protein